MAATQAQTLAERNTQPSGPPQGVKVLIPSALVLTQLQEENILTYCKQSLKKCEDELGRTDYDSGDWLKLPTPDLQKTSASHFGKRYLANLVEQQRMDWRALVLGGLYAESNLHLPITNRIMSQQVAKANKNFFGTAPWFSIDGLSADSDIVAADANAYARHKLVTLGGLQANLEAAVGLAFPLGEAVMKTRRYKMASYFESWREIAIDPETGEPFVAQDGDYIYRTDKFVTPPAAPANPQAAPAAPVLARDGVTPQPAPDMAPLFQTVKIDLKRMLADRIESKPIYYLDFLAPLTSGNIQEKDCFHLYNAGVIELAHAYLTDSKWAESDVKAQMERITNLVKEFLPGTPLGQRALSDQPRPEAAETHQGIHTTDIEPTKSLAECWIWYDVFGDGVQRSLFVLMDKEGNIPVYYDYVANMTPDGNRPFDVIRINPVPGRWYGQGNVERFWGLQEHADLILNRYLFSESRAARVDFWKPQCTREGQDNPNLAVNWGGTYTLLDSYKAEDALTPVYLTNIKSQNLRELLDIVLQMATTMSSVGSVNDSQMAGLDSQKLATGIKNLERTGEEQFHQYLTQLQPAIESVCRRCLAYLLADVAQIDDEKERVVQFFDRDTSRLVSIDPLRLADLDYDIKLELTTYKSQAMLQSAQSGYNMVSDYLTRHPMVQTRLTSFVKQYLQALEVRDADKIATPMTMEEWAMMMPPPPTAPALPAPSSAIPL